MKRPIAYLVTSFALHGVGLVLGAWLVSRSLLLDTTQTQRPADGVDVDLEPADGVELPAMSHAGIRGSTDPAAVSEPKLVIAGGGEHVPRPELHRAGRGGSIASEQAALNLAASDDGLTLNRDPRNRFDRNQVQRIDTNSERRSLDDRRATPNPMELSFLATGPGRVAERRPAARANPSNGSLSGAEPRSLGAEQGGPAVEAGTGAEPMPGGLRGSDREREPAGIPRAIRSRDYRFSAAVTVARPQVTRARAAVPAAAIGRPNDSVDSSQDVASAVASLVHASTAGALQRGAGPGGDSGGGNPAAGGANGPGSRALPSGSGPGPARDSGSDARLGIYTAGVRNRLAGWEHAFPSWAIVDGRGGVATLAFTILADGRISALRVVRSSGIEEFDRKLLEHVQRSAPFAPPPVIASQRNLPLLFTFDAMNPAVGRDGPGRGRVVQR